MRHVYVSTGPVPMFRYFDVLFVLVVAVPALALGAPAFGYAVAAVAWVVQRVLHATRELWVSKLTRSDVVRQVAATVFEAFGRICLLATAIIVAGVAGQRQDGLTAALVIFGAYTVAFVIRLIGGPPARTAR